MRYSFKGVCLEKHPKAYIELGQPCPDKLHRFWQWISYWIKISGQIIQEIEKISIIICQKHYRPVWGYNWGLWSSKNYHWANLCLKRESKQYFVTAITTLKLFFDKL